MGLEDEGLPLCNEREAHFLHRAVIYLVVGK